MLEREVLLDHLMQAERHVAASGELVTRQLEIIDELTRGGRDTTTAMDLLRTLKESKAVHEADFDRLCRELARTI